MQECSFYTYAYLRDDKTPYYVGKGNGSRAWTKGKNEVKPPVDKRRVLILKQNLSESDAFKHEIYLIAVFGRKDIGTGILRNKTNGGDGTSGHVVSDEQKKVQSDKMRGRVMSEKTKLKLSKKAKGRRRTPEAIEATAKGHRGKTRSEEAKLKMSQAAKGRTLSDQAKEKLSRSSRGRCWWVNPDGTTKFQVLSPGPEWQKGRKFKQLHTQLHTQ